MRTINRSGPQQIALVQHGTHVQAQRRVILTAPCASVAAPEYPGTAVSVFEKNLQQIATGTTHSNAFQYLCGERAAWLCAVHAINRNHPQRRGWKCRDASISRPRFRADGRRAI